MTGIPIRVPMFPPIGPLSSCPPVGSLSSTFTRRFFFYVHEHILKPISRLYCWYLGIPRDGVIFPLPFGLILKERPRLRQQEGLAMNLARKMGVSAPRFISFAEPPPTYPPGFARGFTSILMTTVPGVPLDQLEEESVDMEIIYEDLRIILAKMRSFSNPWGDAICGVDGGQVKGYFVPASPMPPHANEQHFHEFIRSVGGRRFEDPKRQRTTSRAEEFFALPPHAIVFTHGDLNKQNIMIGEDGHISGIIDWETAAWLPEYWEFAVPAVFPALPWGKVMDKEVSGGIYSTQITGCQAVFALTADSFEY